MDISGTDIRIKGLHWGIQAFRNAVGGLGCEDYLLNVGHLPTQGDEFAVSLLVGFPIKALTTQSVRRSESKGELTAKEKNMEGIAPCAIPSIFWACTTTSTHVVACPRRLHDTGTSPTILYYMEHDMEPVDEALMINDDNVTTLLDTADQTDAEGMFELHIQYKEAGDEAEADMWLHKAAELGHCQALTKLSACADGENRLALVLKAAELGCNQAQYDLGLWYLHYLYTDHVPKDYVQAAFWLMKAAEQGNMDAQLKLGKMYLEGQGVPQGDDVAVAWIRKSAEQEHEWAYYQLGMMCLDGQGVPQSDEEAAAWFLKAAKLQDFDATYQLGTMYLEGRGVPQDDEQACFWIRKAAEMGDRDAQALLGEMLELGQVTPRNLDEAAEWLAKAADWGEEDAQIRLDRLLRSGVLDPRTRDRIDLLGRDPGAGRVLH